MTEPLSERALQKLLAVAAEPEVLPPLPARYRAVRELGRGGMGVVFEAEDLQLGRRCAVKVIAAGAFASDELRRRFVREAQAAARLQHPHIAAVYDATPELLVMQLVQGGPIDAVRTEPRRFVELVRDAALALQHAHEQGIVHRDVKPSNLLVEGGSVFVVDFGLAKQLGGDGGLSLSGVLLGTPAFMPPEQALGRSELVDARSDVYGLGATLYHCLAARPPFAGKDLPALLHAIVHDEPRPTGVDRELDLVLGKCLAKEPERRYRAASDLAADLDRWLRHEPVHAAPPSRRYRLRKLLQRRRALLRAAGLAALAAVLLTALVLVPIAMREGAARRAADAAVALADQAATVLQEAQTYTRLGDLESAQQALDGGIASARAFLGRHEVARARYLLARLLRARGRGDEAMAELRRAIAADPTLLEARFDLGLMLAAPVELAEADRQQAIALLSQPPPQRTVLGSVDLLFGRAELHRLQGRNAAAREELEEVLAYDATHVAARTSLTQVLLALGEDDLARNVSASIVDLQLGFGPVYLARERGRLPIGILGLDAALVDFAGELAGGPDTALAMAHRGLVHLRRALRLEGEGDAAAALAAVQAGIDDYDAVLGVHDRSAGALVDRGVCQLQAARLHRAAGDVAAAGRAQAAAAADFAAARRLAPALPEAHFNAALLLLGDAGPAAAGAGASDATAVAAARQALQQALAVAPENWPHARACRERLAALAPR